MTNWERLPPSGVRRPWLFRGGVISSEGRGSRVDDWGVSARGRGVVLLDGGFVVLGNNENPPVAPVDGDAILFAGYKLLVFLVCIKQKPLSRAASDIHLGNGSIVRISRCR